MIYFIGDVYGLVKIGYTNDVAKRLSMLQVGNSHELVLRGAMEGDKQDEHRLHRRFEGQRFRGEWFTDSVELSALIAQHPAQWWMREQGAVQIIPAARKAELYRQGRARPKLSVRGKRQYRIEARDARGDLLQVQPPRQRMTVEDIVNLMYADGQRSFRDSEIWSWLEARSWKVFPT